MDAFLPLQVGDALGRNVSRCISGVRLTFIHTVVLEHYFFSFPLLPVGFVLSFSVLRWLAGMALEHFLSLLLLGGFASGFNVFRCITDVRLTFTRTVALEHFLPCSRLLTLP